MESYQQWKACSRKKKFATKEDAYQKGQETYQCHFCGFWHRSGALGKLIAKLSKK